MTTTETTQAQAPHEAVLMLACRRDIDAIERAIDLEIDPLGRWVGFDLANSLWNNYLKE